MAGLLLERRGAAPERAAGAHEVAERVDAPPRLAEDLRPGVKVVRAVVPRQAKLIGPERARARSRSVASPVRPAPGRRPRLGRHGSRGAGHEHDLGAQRSHHPARSVELPRDMTATNGYP